MNRRVKRLKMEFGTKQLPDRFKKAYPVYFASPSGNDTVVVPLGKGFSSLPLCLRRDQ
jgi:hypothetical protein